MKKYNPNKWTCIEGGNPSPRKGTRYIVKMSNGTIVGARYSGSCLWSCDIKPDRECLITHYRGVK